MATCKYCSKSGWLLQVDGLGLCDSCHETHLPILVENTRLFQTSANIAAKSKNPSTTLTRINVAIECAKALTPYDQRGINTIGMHTAEALGMLEGAFKEAVNEAIDLIVRTARSKSFSASTDNAKLSAYGAATEKLLKLSAEFPNVPEFAEKARALHIQQDELRCDLLLNKSAVAEAKGQMKKSLEIAINAYMALIHDATPNELQARMLEKTEARIVALGGKVPVLS